MDTWKNTVITDRGIELQTKLLDGQGLKITKVKAGAGQAPLYDLRSQTEVLDIRQEINLGPAVIKNNQITIPVFLENTKLPDSYDLRQQEEGLYLPQTKALASRLPGSFVLRIRMLLPLSWISIQADSYPLKNIMYILQL